MSRDQSHLKQRDALEFILSFMGFAGICLSILTGLLFMGVGIFVPGEGEGLVAGVLVGAAGVTAGVCLIALSRILSYLRVMASGAGIGEVFK